MSPGTRGVVPKQAPDPREPTLEQGELVSNYTSGNQGPLSAFGRVFDKYSGDNPSSAGGAR